MKILRPMVFQLNSAFSDSQPFRSIKIGALSLDRYLHDMTTYFCLIQRTFLHHCPLINNANALPASLP